MARNPHSKQQANDEEDYIDMDINNIISYSIPSSPNSREFEFQNFSDILQKNNNIPSPADELFYKGKLLPLQLPPRMQMVEKLLQKSTNYNTATSTPFESCNISPATSCYVSGELNPEEFYYEFPKENNKKPWTKLKKLNLKLKASKAYLNLKSLFTKEKKIPFSQILQKSTNVVEEECGNRRRSFSMKRHVSNKSPSTSSSSCSSSNSSSFSSLNSNSNAVLKRSSSVNSDNECSIQGAIAYCKKSQQQTCGRKSVSDVEFYLNSGSKFDVECQKK